MNSRRIVCKVNVKASGIQARATRYEHTDATANHTRRTAMVYPNGRQLDYRYDTQGTDADLLSRIASLAVQGENIILASYEYLGVGSVIGTNYPQPGVAKNLFQTGTTGDAGDIYTSLDRFGRLEEVRWTKAATTLERVLYGYDRVGNRTWRDVLTPAPGGTTPVTGLDEKYAYDGLYQVTQRQRGDLNTARTAISGIPLREEQFAYDPAGNWLGYTSKANGGISLDQRRGHNDLNQIGSLATAQGTAWNEELNPLTSDKVEHDANGNMLLLPHGSDGDWGKAMKLTWDAWNRLVKVQSASDGTEIASYQYDGLWRRTVKRISAETRHYYYNSQWRSIEEHIEKVDFSHIVEQQHLWGAHHRWEYHRRDRDANTSDTNSALSQTHYALQDAMSITAVVDTSGSIIERYQYSAFGQRLCVPASGPISAESTVAWMLGFHVEFSDAGGAGLVDTGLTNYGYRCFDQLCGRWLGRDPMGTRERINLYIAVNNSSINALDILGLREANNCKLTICFVNDESSDKSRAVYPTKEVHTGNITDYVPDTSKTPRNFTAEKVASYKDGLEKALQSCKDNKLCKCGCDSITVDARYLKNVIPDKDLPRNLGKENLVAIAKIMKDPMWGTKCDTKVILTSRKPFYEGKSNAFTAVGGYTLDELPERPIVGWANDPTILAHEMGHVAGYKNTKNPMGGTDTSHSDDPENLMGYGGKTPKPDSAWCDAICKKALKESTTP